MTIKIKIELSEVKIRKDNGQAYLELAIANNYFLALNSDNNELNDLKEAKSILINCSENLALEAENLIDFRSFLIDDSKNDDYSKSVIFLTDLKTIPNIINTNEVELSGDDFEGGFGVDKINIGVANTSINPWLIEEKFENLLIYWKKIINLASNYIEQEQLNADIPKVTKITNDIEFLNNFWIKSAEDGNNSAKKFYSFKKIKEFVDMLIDKISQLKVWKELGFKTFPEARNAVNNKFIIQTNKEKGDILTVGTGELVEKNFDGVTINDDAKANIDKIKSWIKNKKFFGVPIDVVPDNNKSFKPTIGQLMAFGSENWFGKNHDNIDYLSRIHEGDPRKTNGFKPVDIGEDGKYGVLSENMSNNNFVAPGKRCTKIALDILSAPSLEAAVDLTFFGKHYFIVDPNAQDKIIRLDERYQDGSESLLYFNEVDGLNEKETLDFYFSVFQKTECGANNVYNETTDEFNAGNPWGDGNYANKNQAEKRWFKNTYEIVKSFLELYITAKTDKKKITELEEYNITGTSATGSDEETKKKLYEHWKDKITELKKNFSNNYQTKIDKMLTDDTWSKKPYRSVLEHDYIKKNTDIRVLDELKKIFGLLKGAYKTPPTTEKYQLEWYNKLTDNESDSEKQIQKKLWDIIQNQKVDGSVLAWGDEAISKAKIEKIEDLRKRIKNKMKKVGGDAYNKIVEKNNKINDNDEKLRQVEKIFDASAEAWEKVRTNNYLFKILNDSQKNTNEKDAWDAVNSYRKKREQNQWVDSTEGFAQGALNLLKKSLEVSKKFDDLYKETNSADQLATQLQNYINSDEFKKLNSALQTRFKEIIKPRKLAAKRIDVKINKNDDEKALVDLLKLDDLTVKYEDIEEGLIEIKKDLKFLNEVKGAKSGDDKFNARVMMGDNNEKVLDTLISELTERCNFLKVKYQNSPNEEVPTENKDWNWLTSPWFIIPVVFAFFVLVAYLIKKKIVDKE